MFDGAKPRDLQFRGPFLETHNSIHNRIVMSPAPGVSWDRSVAKWRDRRHSLAAKNPKAACPQPTRE
jgi:hypothetical protein